MEKASTPDPPIIKPGRTLHVEDDAAEAVDHWHQILGSHEVDFVFVNALTSDVEDLVAGSGGEGGMCGWVGTVPLS